MKRFYLIVFLCFGSAFCQQVSPVAQNPRTYLDPPSGTQHQTTTPSLATSDLSALILEYNGAIRILEDGLRNNWPVERYLYGTHSCFGKYSSGAISRIGPGGAYAAPASEDDLR